MNTPDFKIVKVDGLDIFYREAGDKIKPTILLLHGFPSSSHMYRDLVNDLSADYHLIAPALGKAVRHLFTIRVSITWPRLLIILLMLWS